MMAWSSIAARIAASIAIVGVIAMGPTWCLLRLAHRFPAWLDAMVAVQIGQVVVLLLALALSGARLRTISAEPITADGLRAGAWLVAGTLIVSLVVMVAIVQGPTPAAGGWVRDITGRWAREIPNSGVIGAVLLLGVVGPATEEFLYRGLILGFLLRTAPAWLALAVSTTLFTVVHTSWPGPAILGLAFGLLYLRFGNIWLCILFHGAHNLVSMNGASIAIAYLRDAGLVFPMEGNLLPLQVTWLIAALGCFGMFLWDVLGSMRGGPLGFLRHPQAAVP